MPIQVKRGLEANLPGTGLSGEPLWTEDTHRLFVGTGTGRVEIGAGGGGSGTVTSVGLDAPTAVFTISGSPVTTSGVLSLGFQDQNAGFFFGGPTSGTGTPVFRALLDSDLPAHIHAAADIASGVLDLARLPDFPAARLTGTRVQAHLASNQSLTQSAWNTVQLDTETEDALGEFNPATYTFTPAETGIYLVDFRCTIGGGSTRNIVSVWQGTTAEAKRLADGALIQAGGMALAPLTAGTGYVFRVFPLDPSTDALGGAANTSLLVRRLF